MKSKEVWKFQIEKPADASSSLTNQVFACCFLKDGDVLVAAVGDALLLFDTQKSDMLRPPLRGSHKDQINCMATSKDGARMATGSTDKTVIIWSYNPQRGDKMLEPENKYSHTDAVLCISFSPLKHQIFSGANQEFALWIPGQGNIDRQKYKDKVVCCAWSADGQYVSFGTMNGMVVITDRQAQALKEIQTQKGGPVWCMDWSPISAEYQSSQLFVGVWMNSLYSFDNSGQQIGSRIELPMDPLSINFHSNGEYLAIAGNNKKVSLYTREGGFLMDACVANDWVWNTKLKPKSTLIACGTNDGDIFVQELLSDNVSALFDDKFMQREQLTDVIILQMITNQKARIKCKELVKRVAIYKEKVAILCGIKVLIYTCVVKGEDFMKYKQFKKFSKRVECEHFQLVSSNVLVGAGQKLIAFNFNGDMDRTWSFESPISVISQQGGAPKRELVLVGLENGAVYKIFIDNSFPIQIHKVNTPIKQLTMSQTKRKLALIDGNQNLQVLDTITKEVLFGEMSVEGVAFNQDFEDLIAYSGKGLLFFKCIAFPALNQKIAGNVIGFKGCKLFLLHEDKVQTIDVQQTANMQKYLEKRDFQNALKIACLGVTEQDIRTLGIEALIAGEFEIARRCFIRNKDFQFIELVQKYEKIKLDTQALNILNAETLAYQGRYMDAGNLLLKVGLADKAVELFTDLKRWEDAKNFAKKGDVAYRAATSQSRAGTAGGRLGTAAGRLGTGRGQAVMPQPQDIAPPKIQMNKLLKEQAEWTKETGDWKAAADLFVSCGEYRKAIDLYGQNKHLDGLIDVCRMLDKQENSENIMLCANYFRKLKHHGGAKEAYLKLNDMKNLMSLHVQFERWQEAFQIGRSNKELLEIAKVPFADYLLRSDRYEEALKAYKSAGRFDISMKMTKDMAKNCIEEQRYHDASQHLWNLAIDCMSQIQDYQNPSGDDVKSIQSFREYSDLADVYYAYQKIHSFIGEPFQPLSGETYFLQIMNAARFIISKWKSTYQGIRMSYVYYALAKCSVQLKCFKTARMCYDKLHSFKIPPEWSEEIDLQSMLVRSKPYTDDESKLPLCMRCQTYNSIIAENNERLSFCNACLHPLYCSFISFSSVPIVEFKVDRSRQDVERLLNSDKVYTNKRPGQLFQDKMNEVIQQQQTSQDQYLPLELDESGVQSLSPEEVLIVDFTPYCSTIEVKYFKNMVPEQPIHGCPDCGRFFFIDEHEFEYVQKRQCPFCRATDKKLPQKDVFDV